MIKPSRRLNRVKRAFNAYQDRTGMVRLDRNEDPTGWEEERLNGFLSKIVPADVAAYADSTMLKEKLAYWLNVKDSCVHVTAGSDAAIKTVFETYVDEGDKIILQNPSWAMYTVYADIYRADPIFVPYTLSLRLPTQRIIDRISQGDIRLVVLANPNQPTATLIPKKALNEIVAVALRNDTIVVIDEAYYLFTPETALEFVDNFPNVIIVRTFSKAFGLAGLRLGYCIADQQRIEDLLLLRPVMDANSLALRFGEHVLDNFDWVQQRVQGVIEGRDYLFKELQQLGILVYPSATNFLLVKCQSVEGGNMLVLDVKKKGYLIKGTFTFFPLEACVRITVGPKILMETFWRDCREYFEKYGQPAMEGSSMSVS